MKNIVFLTALLLSFTVWSEETPLRPVGTYVYHQSVSLTKKRSAETVPRITTEGAKRMAELKKSGYSCIRKNQQDSLCTKVETNLPTPEFIQVAVDKYLEGVTFTFSGTGEPSIVFDGANTEWLVYEDVFLGNKKLEVYKITKTFNGPWYVTFPVSEEQGIGTLNLESNNKLGLPLTLERKEEGQTVGYFITADFTK